MPRALPTRAPLLAALLLSPLVACRDLPERLIAENDRVALKAGLEAAEAAGRIKPLDAPALPDGPALARVLRRPLSAAKLPPMVLTLTGAYAIELPGADGPSGDSPDGGATADDAAPEDAPDGGAAGPPAEASPGPPRIAETRTLRLGPGGAYALDHLTTAGGGDRALADDGRRCRWVDGRFYSGHRHGPFTALAAVADEHHRCLDSALEPIATVIRLFADRLEVAPGGPTTVLGRDGIEVTLSAITGGQAPPPLEKTYGDDGVSEGDSPAIFGLRAPLVVGYTHVESFDGALVLDTETGQPLEGRITARLPFAKAGRRATLTIEMTLAATPLEGAIEAPEGARPYGPRQRIFDDRRRLLGDGTRPKPAAPPALPAPGDAPRLGIDAEGGLRPETGAGPAAAPPDEDRPPPPPAEPPTAPAPGPAQDEDRPE